MKISTSRRSTWIWLVALLVIFISISYVLLLQKPKNYLDYVSQSPAPSGVKALYTYLESEVDRVDRWSHSPELLSRDDDLKVLMMVEPLFVPDTEEMEAYLSFIERGNTLILFKTNPHGMFDLSTFQVEPVDQGEYISVFDAEENQYRAIFNSFVRLIPENGEDVLLSDEVGPIALKQEIGKGNLISVVTPELLTNESVTELDHLDIVFSILYEAGIEQTLLFDEYVHEKHNRSTVFTIYPSWFLVLMLQAILLIVLWLWALGKRFGYIHVVREESVRFSDEGLKALAVWYSRGRMYKEALTIQADYCKLLLQEKWGVPYNKDWIDCEETIARRVKHISPQEVSSLLKGMTEILQKAKLRKQEYLLWTKKIDQLRKELEVDNEQRYSKITRDI
ncbi:DUF4350 domain-containing protein [Bacillus sp. PS06]|uniref:DUF4350 domain-containing protein n=1 Tax=Bacillus sp. PS06 TaxID=2764176 RepID=UPI0017841515|nr:DUF4350 domain-containing protein [Bacillus sp. PS06]MBD8067681.1 DUF4350 domain-containing protein [Bacillus sp. PS06]